MAGLVPQKWVFDARPRSSGRYAWVACLRSTAAKGGAYARLRLLFFRGPQGWRVAQAVIGVHSFVYSNDAVVADAPSASQRGHCYPA